MALSISGGAMAVVVQSSLVQEGTVIICDSLVAYGTLLVQVMGSGVDRGCQLASVILSYEGN